MVGSMARMRGPWLSSTCHPPLPDHPQRRRRQAEMTARLWGHVEDTAGSHQPHRIIVSRRRTAGPGRPMAGALGV